MDHLVAVDKIKLGKRENAVAVERRLEREVEAGECPRGYNGRVSRPFPLSWPGTAGRKSNPLCLALINSSTALSVTADPIDHTEAPALLTFTVEVGARAQTQARRYRHHGQPLQPPGAKGPPDDRGPLVQACASCRPTALTSTRSRTPPPNLKRPCSRPPSAPSTACGPQSDASSICSRQPSAKTTSKPQDGITLSN